jgi:hypothetical protein
MKVDQHRTRSLGLCWLEAANAIHARNDHVGPQHVRAIDRLAERLWRSGDA